MTIPIPLGNKILVRPCESKTSAGGIVIPDNARRDKNEAERCEVLAIGPGTVLLKDGKRISRTVAELVGSPLKVGDYIYCSRFYGVHSIRRADNTYEKLKIVSAEDTLLIEVT